MLKKCSEFFNTRMSLLNKSLQVLVLHFAFVVCSMANWVTYKSKHNLPIKKEESNKQMQILTMSCCRTYSNT